MKSFEEFTITDGSVIVGGELYPTYVGRHGDFYDSVNDRYVFLKP